VCVSENLASVQTWWLIRSGVGKCCFASSIVSHAEWGAKLAHAAEVKNGSDAERHRKTSQDIAEYEQGGYLTLRRCVDYRGVVKISVSHSVMYCRTALRSVFTSKTIEYHTSNVATTFWRILHFMKCWSGTKLMVKSTLNVGIKNTFIFFIMCHLDIKICQRTSI